MPELAFFFGRDSLTARKAKTKNSVLPLVGQRAYVCPLAPVPASDLCEQRIILYNTFPPWLSGSG